MKRAINYQLISNNAALFKICQLFSAAKKIQQLKILGIVSNNLAYLHSQNTDVMFY